MGLNERLFGIPITADEVIASHGITNRESAGHVRRTFGHVECPTDDAPECWCDTCLGYLAQDGE